MHQRDGERVCCKCINDIREIVSIYEKQTQDYTIEQLRVIFSKKEQFDEILKEKQCNYNWFEIRIKALENKITKWEKDLKLLEYEAKSILRRYENDENNLKKINSSGVNVLASVKDDYFNYNTIQKMISFAKDNISRGEKEKKICFNIKDVIRYFFIL